MSYSPQLARHGGANPCRRGDRIRYLLIGNRAGSRVRPIEIRSLLILTHVRPPIPSNSVKASGRVKQIYAALQSQLLNH